MFISKNQIKVVKNMNKLLEKNNNEMKATLVNSMLENLPPLPKIQSFKSDKENCSPEIENFKKLSKQSNDLMKVGLKFLII